MSDTIWVPSSNARRRERIEAVVEVGGIISEVTLTELLVFSLDRVQADVSEEAELIEYWQEVSSKSSWVNMFIMSWGWLTGWLHIIHT